MGLIFDGNIESLGGDYGFDESEARAVAIRAIIEALRHIYDAGDLADEIAGQAVVTARPAR